MALWLPGVRLFPLRFHHEQADLLDDPETYREVAGVDVGDVTSWLMFAEPFRIDAQPIMRGLSRCYPGVPIMGGMASGMIGDRTSCVFLDHQVYDEGAVAIGFGGPYRLEPSVAHGCDPIGETWTITETERNLLIGISNRPALGVMRSTIAGHQSDDPDHVLRNLMIGLAANEYADGFGRGDFLVRGVLAVDEERGAIAVGGMPRVGQTMQFQLRSARVASLDLSRILVDLALSGLDSAVAAILCTCDGRGKALFGEEGHDATMVQAGLPGIPLAGAFCLGEIGPMGAEPGTHSTELHGVTATLGVLRYQPGG
jgi:small ligand-binding sensory domain FIST